LARKDASGPAGRELEIRSADFRLYPAATKASSSFSPAVQTTALARFADGMKHLKLLAAVLAFVGVERHGVAD